MTLDACASIVERGDPDRWRAVLAAPVDARPKLIPLYAFNIEVARAPWLTQEPLIAEMRLQWWADVLEEISENTPVRRHEVATPLSEVLSPEAARILVPLVEARRRDVHREPFDAKTAAQDYITSTAGALAAAASACLGGDAEQRTRVHSIATAGGLARLLQATPELERRGWRLWRAMDESERRDLITTVLNSANSLKKRLQPAEKTALIADWQAFAILSLALKEPARIGAGTLSLSPFRDRYLLLRAAMS